MNPSRLVSGVFNSYAATDKFYPGDKWDRGYLRGNFRQLQHLKKKHPHLKNMVTDVLIGDVFDDKVDILWPLMDELRAEVAAERKAMAV